MTQAIKLLALDLDGTLALDNHQVSPATKDALCRLHQDDVNVVIATGRRYRTTRFVIENLGFDVATVCNGGALVKDHQQNTLHETAFNRKELEHVISTAREFGLTVSAQRNSHSRGGADFILDTFNPWNMQVQHYFDENATFSSKADLLAMDDRYLVLGVFDRSDILQAFTRVLLEDDAQRFNTVIVPHRSTGYHYCEVTQNHITKWHGLTHLARHFNITADNICAVGDELNDLPMIEAAAHGVAMGNANPQLKAVAKFVCGDNEQDGLLDVVNYINNHNAIHG